MAPVWSPDERRIVVNYEVGLFVFGVSNGKIERQFTGVDGDDGAFAVSSALGWVGPGCVVLCGSGATRRCYAWFLEWPGLRRRDCGG